MNGPGILVGRKGTVGAIHYASGPFWPIDTVYYVVPRREDNLRFLQYLLDYLPLHFLNAATGVPGLSRRDAHSLLGVFPPLEEQAAIARILDAVDTALERTRQTVERAQDYKRALVQRVFAEGLYGEIQQKSPIGYIPRSWRVVPLNCVVENFQYGLSMPMDDRGDLPILRMGNIQNGDVEFSDLKYVNLPDDEVVPYLLNRGDVLFNRTNSQEWVGKVAIVRHTTPAVFASYLIRLHPITTKVDPFYLGHVLGTHSVQCRIKRFATPGVQQVNVNATNLGKVLIPLPVGDTGLQEQRRIGTLLDAAHDLIKGYDPAVSALEKPQEIPCARPPHRKGPGSRHSGGDRIMSEYGYVEQPILNWLCGEAEGAYRVGGMGWTYRDEAAMAEFGRPLEDPLVEPLLKEAIVRINPHVATETQAWRAVEALRKAMGQPDRLGANRATLDLLRDGARVVLRPGEDARTVHFIAIEAGRQHLNDFTATNQYRVQGIKQCRDDTVLLVNGIPLVVAEYKSYVTSGKDWREAVRQLHRYQRQAPLMLAPNVFGVAADEDEFPLRDGVVSRCEQGGRRPPPRPVGPLAQSLSGPSRLVERTRGRRSRRPAGDACQRSPAAEAGARARFSSTLRCLRDQERRDEEEDCSLSSVRGGERAGGSHGGACGSSGSGPGSDRPDLAHPGLRQDAHHGVRRPEAAPPSDA